MLFIEKYVLVTHRFFYFIRPELKELDMQFILIKEYLRMADLIPGKKVNLFLDSFNALADKNGILPIRLLGTLLRSVGDNPTQVEVPKYS